MLPEQNQIFERDFFLVHPLSAQKILHYIGRNAGKVIEASGKSIADKYTDKWTSAFKEFE